MDEKGQIFLVIMWFLSLAFLAGVIFMFFSLKQVATSHGAIVTPPPVVPVFSIPRESAARSDGKLYPPPPPF